MNDIDYEREFNAVVKLNLALRKETSTFWHPLCES